MLTVPTLAEQMPSHTRCVPKTEKFFKNSEGMKVVKIMEAIQMALAESSLFISVCLMVFLLQLSPVQKQIIFMHQHSQQNSKQ